MTTQTLVTIGWTKHDGSRTFNGQPYGPFFDPYIPGQPQHTETIWVDVADDFPSSLEADADAKLDAVRVIAEEVFHATNAPFVPEGSRLAQIAAAIEAKGYHGEGAHYSLSIGDTVTVAGLRLGCAREGWVQV